MAQHAYLAVHRYPQRCIFNWHKFCIFKLIYSQLLLFNAWKLAINCTTYSQLLDLLSNNGIRACRDQLIVSI